MKMVEQSFEPATIKILQATEDRDNPPEQKNFNGAHAPPPPAQKDETAPNMGRRYRRHW